MSFPYKHVLLIGATSGIGKAMADKLISSNIHVTAVGRRKDRLDDFVSAHGSSKASSLIFDIADLDGIPAFVENAMKTHPTIDSIFLNAGIQHRYNFAKPNSVDLSRFNREITTNFTSFVAITHAFLPHLLSSPHKTSLIYTGTHLSLVPASTMPAYSASKAALDAFIMCLREQLRDTSISVVHLSPPPVQTELHDAELGAEVGRKMGMPVGEFTEEAWKELESGKQNIIIGSVGASSKEQFMEIVEKREEAFERLSALFRKFM